jgi:hypothetical protein
VSISDLGNLAQIAQVLGTIVSFLAVAFLWRIRASFVSKEEFASYTKEVSEEAERVSIEANVHRSALASQMQELVLKTGQIEHSLSALPSIEKLHDLELMIVRLEGVVNTQAEIARRVEASAQMHSSILRDAAQIFGGKK